MPKQCGGCGEALTSGTFTQALDKYWHPACFKCNHCQKGIEGGYHMLDDQLLDEACYEELRQKTWCHGCPEQIPVGVEYFKAMDKTWHKKCFTCVMCDEDFIDANVFSVWREQPIHAKCLPDAEAGKRPKRMPKGWAEEYDKKEAEEAAKKAAEEEAARKKKEEEEAAAKAKEAPKEEPKKEEPPKEELKGETADCDDKKERNYPPCTACSEPIKEGARVYGDKKFHYDCFKCPGCDKMLDDNGPFPFKNNRLWHEPCVPRNNCGKCNERIAGKEMNALGKYWHPDCFVCCKCSGPMEGSFAIKDGLPIHSACQ